MASDTRGRPKSSSRGALEDAATELFLESGYHATTVDDIAARAGVSRATFFNYFPAKSSVLWVKVDDALDALEQALGTGLRLPQALRAVAESYSSSGVPLIATQADAMNTGDDLDADAGRRIIRLSSLVSRSGVDRDSVWSTTGVIVQAALEWALAGVERQGPLYYLERHQLTPNEEA
jgi:AcrR family transcriptional regulator